MANNLFNPEGFVWKPFGYIADILMLSLMWVVFSIPIVTIGASTTALYDAVAHGFRRKESVIYGRFWRTFKAEFLSSLPQTLLWGGLTLGGFFLLRGFTGSVSPSDSAFVAAVAGAVLLLFVSGMSCWVFPVLSRFTFHFSGLFLTAVKLAFSHPFTTLFLALTLWGCALLCLRFLLPVFCLPALLMLLWSLPLEHIFAKYSSREDDMEEEE